MSAGTPRHRARSDVAPAADRVWPCGSCIDRRGAPAVLRVEACAEVEEAVDCVRGAGEGEDGAAVRRHHGQAFAIEELVDARVIAEHQRFDHADARTAGELFEERVIPSVVEGPGGEGGAPSAHPGPSTTLGMTRHPLPEMSPLEETLSDYQSAEVTIASISGDHAAVDIGADLALGIGELRLRRRCFAVLRSQSRLGRGGRARPMIFFARAGLRPAGGRISNETRHLSELPRQLRG